MYSRGKIRKAVMVDFTRGGWWSGFAFSLLLGLCLGCQSEPPSTLKTYTSKGMVKFKDNVPLKGGLIQFMSEANESLNISALIQPDGSFELKTLDGNHNLAGSVQGKCQVMVTLPIVSADPPTIFRLNETVEVKPEDNQFEIILPVTSTGKSR